MPLYQRVNNLIRLNDTTCYGTTVPIQIITVGAFVNCRKKPSSTIFLFHNTEKSIILTVF